MARKKKEAMKYGAPLYCAAWPPGDFALVAGGGGKASSGIRNKVIVVRRQGTGLSEGLETVPVDDAPLRMATNPQGTALLLVVGSGALRRFDLQQRPGHPPHLAPAEGPAPEGATALKCLEFSADGRLVALGAEDGRLLVLEWPSLAVRLHLRGEDALRDGVRDVDFSPGHHNKVLAATCEDGTCTLWDWQRGAIIKALTLPPGLEKGGSFSRCCFARDGSRQLFTTVNQQGEGWLVAFAQVYRGAPATLRCHTGFTTPQAESGALGFSRKAKAHTGGAVTAFGISPSGELLGTGTSEGDVAIHSSSKLSPLLRIRGGHMVFVTALAFAPDDSALLSVSADASAQVLNVKLPTNPYAVTPLMVVFALVTLVIAVLLGRFYQLQF